jgi:hypothetical protein
MKNKTALWIVGGFFIVSFALSAAILSLLLPIFSMSNSASSSSDPVPPAQVTVGQLRDFEAKARLRLPHAVQIKFYREESGGPDAMIQFKLGMKNSDLAELLAQPTLQKVKWHPVEAENSFTNDYEGWPEWSPSKVRKGRRAQVDLPNAKYLNILIDDTSANEKGVYFMWFET